MSAHLEPTLPFTTATASRAAAASHARLGISWRAIALIATAKLLVFAAVWFSYTHVDFATVVYEPSTHFHEPAQYGFLTRFTTWDSSHYLILARDGYSHEVTGTNAFAPLLPLTIRAVGWLTGDLIIAGLIVSNLASAVACYLLYAFVRKRWGAATASHALVLLLAFPTSFFLCMVYTESIFLLLAVTVFYAVAEALESPYSARGRALFALAALAAFLMPLTRPIGVVVALPMALALLWHDRPQDASMPWRLQLRPRVLLALAPLLGVAAHLGYMQAVTGDYLMHVHAQDLYGAQWNLVNVLKPWVFAHEIFGRGLTFHSQLNSSLDRLFFLGFLLSAPLVYRRVSLPLFLLYAALGLLPPLMGSFMAYTRFLLPAFPLYIAWADYLRTRPRLLRGAVTLMALMQFAAILAHTSSRWVA
jgi:Dolichyl-phosphate-mannose-protein mannosyltransferase